MNTYLSDVTVVPIPEPDISEFRNLLDAAANWADEVGMTEDDISSAIKSVRKAKRSAK